MPGKYLEYIRSGRNVVPVEISFLSALTIDEDESDTSVTTKWVEKRHWKEIKALLKPAVETAIKNNSLPEKTTVHHVVNGLELRLGYLVEANKQKSPFLAILDPARNYWSEDDDNDGDQSSSEGVCGGGRFRSYSPTKVYIKVCVMKKTNNNTEDSKRIRKHLGIKPCDMRNYLTNSNTSAATYSASSSDSSSDHSERDPRQSRVGFSSYRDRDGGVGNARIARKQSESQSSQSSSSSSNSFRHTFNPKRTGWSEGPKSSVNEPEEIPPDSTTVRDSFNSFNKPGIATAKVDSDSDSDFSLPDIDNCDFSIMKKPRSRRKKSISSPTKIRKRFSSEDGVFGAGTSERDKKPRRRKQSSAQISSSFDAQDVDDRRRSPPKSKLAPIPEFMFSPIPDKENELLDIPDDFLPPIKVVKSRRKRERDHTKPVQRKRKKNKNSYYPFGHVDDNERPPSPEMPVLVPQTTLESEIPEGWDDLIGDSQRIPPSISPCGMMEDDLDEEEISNGIKDRKRRKKKRKIKRKRSMSQSSATTADSHMEIESTNFADTNIEIAQRTTDDDCHDEESGAEYLITPINSKLKSKGSKKHFSPEVNSGNTNNSVDTDTDTPQPPSSTEEDTDKEGDDYRDGSLSPGPKRPIDMIVRNYSNPLALTSVPAFKSPREQIANAKSVTIEASFPSSFSAFMPPPARRPPKTSTVIGPVPVPSTSRQTAETLNTYRMLTNPAAFKAGINMLQKLNHHHPSSISDSSTRHRRAVSPDICTLTPCDAKALRRAKKLEKKLSKGSTAVVRDNDAGEDMFRALLTRIGKGSAYEPKGDEYDLSQPSVGFVDVYSEFPEKYRRFKQHSSAIGLLTFERIAEIFTTLKPVLRGIFLGQGESVRHRMYFGSHQDKKMLKEINVGLPFTELHSMQMITFLYEFLFPEPETRVKFADYITYVMIPEAFIRIFAGVNKLTFEMAEIEMRFGACYEGDPHTQLSKLS